MNDERRKRERERESERERERKSENENEKINNRHNTVHNFTEIKYNSELFYLTKYMENTVHLYGKI